MALRSRQDLIDYCLRKLGYPVIDINVADEQIEDRIDDAFQVFNEYHSEGSIRQYLPITITQAQIDAQAIDFTQIAEYQDSGITDRILNVIRVLPINSESSSVNFFDLKYQMRLNDLWDLQTGVGDLAYYEQMQQYLSTIDLKLNGTPTITYQRRGHVLRILGDLTNIGDLRAGDKIVVEVYLDVTPTGRVHDELFLKEFGTALIKKQWGENISKFEGVQLPGGVTINGARLIEEADREIERLREKLINEYDMSLPLFMG